MKIFNLNTNIVGYVSKVIETKNGFLLNTQYYAKENLNPIPFQNLVIYSSHFELITHKSMHLNNLVWFSPEKNFGIVRDINNKNRSYLAIQAGYIDGSTRAGYIRVIEENENGEIADFATTSFGDTQIMECVYQDDNYIYLIIKGANPSCYLTRFNKKTYAHANGISYSGNSSSLPVLRMIYQDEAKMIFTVHTNGRIIYFYNYNISANTSTTAKTITLSTALYYTTQPQDSYNEGSKYGTYYMDMSKPEEPIDFYYYDIETNEYNSEHVTITWGGGISELPFLAVNTGAYITYSSFISEFNNIKYFNVALYVTNYVSNIINIQGVYTFRMNSATNFTFTGYNPVSRTELIGGCLYDDSKEHLVIAKNGSFQILKFDQNTLRYESTGYDIAQCYSVGFDELQRLWYVKNDGTVHMINLEDAQSVAINFEKPYYDYLGVAINTYIEFSALNYLNEEMAGTFELTISGPAVFTENNSNILNFVYNGNGVQQIGIVITGASPITIYPKFIS